MVRSLLDNTFVQKVLALAITTICVIGVLLVTAQNPSQDEFTRGGAAGIVGYLAMKLFCRGG